MCEAMTAYYLSKNRYYLPFSVTTADVDYCGRLRLDSLFLQMQIASDLGSEQLGFGIDSLLKKDYCWLLAGYSLNMMSYPGKNQLITIETWCAGTSRVLYHRDYRIWLGDPSDKQLLGYATAEWFVARISDHRPVRPQNVCTQEMIDCFNKEERAGTFQSPRMKSFRRQLSEEYDLQSVGGVLGGKTRVEYSDIDKNQHLNNARYVARCLDALYRVRFLHSADSISKGLFVKALSIEFVSEVYFGEHLSVWSFDTREDSEEGAFSSCDVSGDRLAGSAYIEGLIDERRVPAFRSHICYEQCP